MITIPAGFQMAYQDLILTGIFITNMIILARIFYSDLKAAREAKKNKIV